MARKPKPEPFRAFTTHYGGLVNQITLDIRLSAAFDPSNPPNPSPVLHDVVALWDTGATKSVITKSVANQLGLKPTGVAKVIHAGGGTDSTTYMVNIYLPNKVGMVGVRVTECPDEVGNGKFGAIIGMDIIGQGDFSISNHDGKTKISFRVPSFKPVDYVLEWHKIVYSGISLASPCICGRRDNNGKAVRFGQCHGKYLADHS